MQRHLASCAFALLLACAALLLLVSQAAEQQFVPGTTPTADGSASANPESSQDAARQRGDRVQATSEASLARSQVPDRASAVGNEVCATPVRVLVIDGGTRLPVAGAAVCYLATEALEAAKHALAAAGQPVPQDAEPLIRKHGGSVVTDVDGFATLQWVENTMLVVRQGERYGAANVYDPEEVPPGGVLVVLDRDRSVKVKVVDASGAPVVGLPIRLWACGQDGSPQELYPHQGATSTAPDGMAEICHLQELLEDDAAPGSGAVRLMPVVGLPGCPLDGPRFSLAAPPDSPLTLVAPPLGAIHLHDPHGILEAGCGLWLEAVDGPKSPFRADGSYQGDRWVFPAVGVGRQFLVTESVAYEHMRCDGPRVSGEVVRVSWELPGDAVQIKGRLAGADGGGIPNTPMVIRLPSLKAVRCKTDQDSAFSLYLDSAQRLRHTKTLEFRVDSLPGQQATASNLSLTAGTHDLGELRLQPLPLVASGVLRGGAKIDLPQQLMLECPLVAPNGELYWGDCRGVMRPVVLVSEAGEFQILGTCPYPELRLSLRFHSLQGGPVVFTPPATGIDLVVVAPCKVMASALLPRDLPDDCIGVLSPVAGTPIVPRDSSGRNPCMAHGQRNGDRVVFEWHVRAGRYDLTLHAMGFPRPLVAIPGVSTETAKLDERLANIDLMSAVAGLLVEVVDEEGKRVDARMHAADCDRLGFAGTAHVDGRAVCLVPEGPLDLMFHEHEFQPVVARGVRGEVRVVMEHRAKTEFRFAAAAALPSQFVCRLSVATPPNFRFDWSDPQTWYRTDGTMGTFAGEVAELRFGSGPVTLEMQLVSLASGKIVPLTGVQPNPVRYSKTPIALTVPAQVLEAALAQLR